MLALGFAFIAIAFPVINWARRVKNLSTYPRQYALVKLVDPHQYYDHGSFHRDDFQFMFLGEIPNMMGHCAVVGWSTGKVYCGFHIENFVELSEDD